jgi:DNA-binding NarL/FixJ family response regulator
MLPICVLLADDSPVFLELAARILSADPRFVVVGQAVSGHDVLEQVTLLDPDLVLMDWAMPGMNGLEATRRIKAQPGAPRVVMLTLHDHPEYRTAAKAAGADGFIAKWEFDTQLESLIHGFFVALAEGEGRFAPQSVVAVC